MFHSISEMVNRFIEHPRDILIPQNLIIAGCVGLVARLVIIKLAEILIDFVDSRRNTPNLRIIFRKPYEPGLLKTMDDVLMNATTDISSLGWRYITVNGYRGRIAMEEVADRIEWLSNNQTNITKEDLAIGQTFAEKILDLYDQGDEKFKHLDLLIGFVCFLRDNNFDLVGADVYGSGKWHGHSVFQRAN